jgi:hypothetical protein
MSADKRTVTTDALETLGSIIGENEKRDAIHLAVDPAIAGEYLEAGDHVTLQGGVARRVPKGKGLGIVDPFLTVPVNPGNRFWLVVYPRQVTSLRHVWEHPAFAPSDQAASAKPASTDVSVAYLQDVADSVGISYERLLEGAEGYLRHGDYIVGGDEMESMSVPDEFWDHYQKVTGRIVPESQQGNFFSCSC